MENEKMKVVLASCAFLTLASSIAAIIVQSNRKRNRRYGVRPMNRKRDSYGFFATLVNDMRTIEWDDEQFFKYTRMTNDQFTKLLELVKPHLIKDRKKKHICPEQRLLMTLHYLSAGCSIQEIAWGYRVGKTTARNIVIEVCGILWEVLAPVELPVPTSADFSNIATEFFLRWNIPNCIGAVDGKHIAIKAPKNSGSEFFNYRKHFSLVLMATCDAYMRFTMVDIGAAGSNHDSTVFKGSGLGRALLSGQLDIPLPKNLPNTNIKLPDFIIGDAAFPLHNNIIRPYPGSNLGAKKNIFNYRISRARRTIESAFGILTQRWQILKGTIQSDVDVCQLMVQATIVLHNYLQNSERNLPVERRRYCPTGFSDYVDENGDMQAGRWREEGQALRSVSRIGSNNSAQDAKNQRDQLSDYFISKEGWLPWQEDYVRRRVDPDDHFQVMSL